MKWILSIVLFLLVSIASAEEPKAGQVKPVATPVSKTGKLSASSDSDKSIVAALHVEEPGEKKKGKKNSSPASEPSINLVASGDMATKLADYVTKNTLIEVSGNLADGKLAVTEVKEVAEPTKKKKNKSN